MTNLTRRLALVAGTTLAAASATNVAVIASVAKPAWQTPKLIETGLDPIFAAIEQYQYWDERTDVLWPESGPASAEAEEARDNSVAARWTLCDTTPTTMAGLLALLDFAVSEQERLELAIPDNHDEMMAFISSMARSVRRLAVQS